MRNVFLVQVELVITKANGGRWRFEIRLEATQPDVDGHLEIAASPGQASLSPLRLFAPGDEPLAFSAHFSHDSSMQFDVAPAKVDLCHAELGYPSKRVGLA